MDRIRKAFPLLLLGVLGVACARQPYPEPARLSRAKSAQKTTPAPVATPSAATAARHEITGARGYVFTDLGGGGFDKKISLTVKNAELVNVVRLLARHAGMNIVANPDELRGRVTVDLRNVTVGAALRAILRSNGLELIREPGDTHRVTRTGAVRRNPSREKTVVHVPLNWVPAAEVKKTLDPVVDGEVVADPLSNSIIIADTPKRVEEIVRIIRGMDNRGR